MLPFDYAGLFKAIGSDAETERRLDSFFKKLVCWGEPCFNIADEPSFVTPFAYTFLGRPAKTDEVLNRIENEAFSTGPSGLAGNDDLGATSGVYIWAALGLYPAIPGSSGFVLGTPRFAGATVRAGSAYILKVQRVGTGLYVQSVLLNGKHWSSSWLPKSALVSGVNTLTFVVGTSPNSWATGAQDRPPSLSDRPCGALQADTPPKCGPQDR